MIAVIAGAESLAYFGDPQAKCVVSELSVHTLSSRYFADAQTMYPFSPFPDLSFLHKTYFQ